MCGITKDAARLGRVLGLAVPVFMLLGQAGF